MEHFIVDNSSITNAPTARDVFEVFHFIIEADHDLTAHEVWVLAHDIVYPQLARRPALQA